MDDKIEAWVQQAMQLADARELARSNVAQSFWSDEAKEQLARASDDLAAHLRTTPEGFVLVKAEPVAWLIHYTTHGQPRSQVQQHNAVGDIRALFDPKATVTELYAAPMLAASQESANAA